jgi:hypothetical protein
LWAITGNLDVPGGNVFSRFAFNAVAYALPGAEGVIKLKQAWTRISPASARIMVPFSKFIWRTQTDVTLDQIAFGPALPGQGTVDTGLQYHGQHRPGPQALERGALIKLDFIVRWICSTPPAPSTPTWCCPRPASWKRTGCVLGGCRLQSINKAIHVDDCKPDVEINFELARRFDPDFKWDSMHQLYDEIIKPSGHEL